MRSILILTSLVLALPGAAAIDPVCVDATCAGTSSWGVDCSGDEPFQDAGRRVSVDSGSHHLAVQNWCYVVDFGDYAESGSGVGINYYSYDESTGEYRAAGVQWYDYDWEAGGGGGSFCEVTAYSYGNDPVPNGGNPAPCVDGGPGMIFPALP